MSVMRNRSTNFEGDEETGDIPLINNIEEDDRKTLPVSKCDIIERYLGIKPDSKLVKSIESIKDKDPSSFKVIGVEISSWSPNLQYIYCTTLVMFFLLVYGLLQEYVIVTKFKRSFSWFVTFLQLTGYSISGYCQMTIFPSNNSHIRKIPVKYYILLAILQVMMQGFSNFSMHYLNYPAKTLFKSSRITVTMIFGKFCMGRKYTRNDNVVALFIIIGLGLFVYSDASTSPHFDHLGVFYILLSLFADAAILNIQEYSLDTFQAGHDELIYYTYMYAAVLACIVSYFTGNLS
jgi:adenosine 3'-phospho 5'-phosphosulfate transporter B2